MKRFIIASQGLPGGRKYETRSSRAAAGATSLGEQQELKTGRAAPQYLRLLVILVVQCFITAAHSHLASWTLGWVWPQLPELPLQAPRLKSFSPRSYSDKAALRPMRSAVAS